MIKKHIFVGFIFIAVIFFIHFLLSGKFLTLEHVQQYRIFLCQLVESRYFFSVSLYLLVFIFGTVLGLPVTVLLTVAAGYFFGVWPGVMYANIGATVGAIISFLLFRYLFGSFIQKRYAGQLKAFNQAIKEYDHNLLLTMQFLPFTPTLLINIFAGLTRISLWTFVWTTSLGILPGGLLYAVSGQHLAQIRSLQDLWSAQSFSLLILLALFAFLPILFRNHRSAAALKDSR